MHKKNENTVMRISMVYFLFPFLIQSFSYCYIPQRNSIEVFARKPHKNNLPLGTHSSRIQLPYTRPRHYQTKHANFNSHTEKPLFQEQYYQQVCQYIETNFQQKYHEFKYYCEHEYGEHNDGHYAVLNRNHRIEKRFGALQDIESIGVHYALYNYVLPQDVINYLKTVDHNADSYTFCYGNQIQHSIHEDCIMLLQEASMIPVSSIMHSRVSAIIDCIDAARIYNQAADCLKACTVQDFCWSLLEYGKAVAEGVVWGAVGAVHDCLQHPLHTAACVIIPEGVLVYQLSKILVNVADIGVTYLFNKEKGKRKLHDYIAPVAQISNQGKKQLGWMTRDKTHLNVSLYGRVTHK